MLWMWTMGIGTAIIVEDLVIQQGIAGIKEQRTELERKEDQNTEREE